jgi:hypothetical protein
MAPRRLIHASLPVFQPTTTPAGIRFGSIQRSASHGRFCERGVYVCGNESECRFGRHGVSGLRIPATTTDDADAHAAGGPQLRATCNVYR